MRVAVDARALLGQSTGIGTYTRGISLALAARDGIEVGLFTPRPIDDPPSGNGAVSLHADRHRFGTVWVQTTLPGRAASWGADALLAALTIGPARGETPLVSVVHDLTTITHPEWHAARTLVGFLPLWESTVERAARFLCVSGATARELAGRYPEVRARIAVARNGVDAEFSPFSDAAAAERTRRRFAKGRRYVLYLGTLEPRKDVETLVTACERLWTRRRARPDLVLAGGAGWKSLPLYRRIARSAFRDKIHVAGYASRSVAVDLYRAAEAFVYPSLAEGFGLPVAEAMACGTPVVASDIESLREVAGDAAILVPPRDAARFAIEIERVLEDEPARESLRQAGPRRAALFTWEAAAEATAAALEQAAGATRRTA
ncbi:MAG TPA: glycosyltransferase family 1 protein [Thermoanaerobaculia bacterium]|nr:glycosyltransferase family 1 protein [Thermoanaerobaculia bacterium]